MNKYEIVRLIEEFAPCELQEKWDCSGWLVETKNQDISRVMVALTVTEQVFKQALAKNCEMIISHHPLFEVPLWFKGLDIYCAHTNMDKTLGGTTDTFANTLGINANPNGEFLRIADLSISLKELSQKIKKVSPNARIINNQNVKEVSKIAFCAGSGMDLYKEAKEKNCDCFITGDIKYHSAIDSDIVMYDVGHFESEVLIKKVFQRLIEDKIEVFLANEESPFKNI